MSLIYSILIFGFIVFIHELGHYLFAVRSGIYVEEFAIGMGYKLFSFNRNDTVFSIRILPLGGYCKMLGEDSESDDPRSFGSKSVGARISVVVAGAFFNAVLALVIFIGFTSFSGYATTSISTIVPNSFAETNNLQEGDKILKVNDENILTFNDLAFTLATISDEDAKDATITILRDDKKIEVTDDLSKNSDGKYNIGFTPIYAVGVFANTDDYKDVPHYEASFFECISQGFYNMMYMVESTVKSIMLLINRSIGTDQLSGPVGIVTAIGDTYEQSSKQGISVVVLNMLSIMALLSANLAVFNLLPFPALDGGRLVFLIIEGVTGKPVSPNVENIIHTVGFVLLMGLALYVTFNDILKLF